MNANPFTNVAEKFIDGFDATAHTLIGAYREGGDRLATAARERWDSALKESSPHLTAETRRNANHARDVFGGYYGRGIALSASGAEVAVSTLVQAARVAVERAATWQQHRA